MEKAKGAMVGSAVATQGDASLGLRERKKAALKARIAEEALSLFRAGSYEDVTIEAIVRRVEISQPTFYKYYPSKDAILMEHAMRGFGPLLMGVVAEQGSVVERLERYLRAVAEQMHADSRLWMAIAVSNAYNPIRNPELLSASEAGTRVLEALLAEGQARGEFSTDYSARKLASFVEGLLFRTVLEWGARFSEADSLADAMLEALAFFVRGARPNSA